MADPESDILIGCRGTWHPQGIAGSYGYSVGGAKNFGSAYPTFDTSFTNWNQAIAWEYYWSLPPIIMSNALTSNLGILEEIICAVTSNPYARNQFCAPSG
jgi:hypothetical protein